MDTAATRLIGMVQAHWITDALCAAADLVTEMKPLKHPFEQGHKAQPGIDF